MPLVTTTEMFKQAYKEGYAIGAFNVNNMEIVQGITEAAAEEKAPVILQVSAGARKYAKHIYLTKLVEAAVADTGLPIALHLDHGADFEICKSCVDGGFTSVMIDGSHHDYEDNVALTKKVVEYAHAHGVVVEGELGQLAGIEDDIIPSKRALEESEKNIDEERRLFYVAITRARKKLVINYSDSRITREGEEKMVIPSRFLEEIPAELFKNEEKSPEQLRKEQAAMLRKFLDKARSS